ncbi:DNA cytosine methyltransferase [Streptomyces sp. R302]|nr:MULTISPECIES: DNA cytosine methyltransferase [unclassified Streptomyces]NML50566.1 DNA cytosine methyltransferase [Streptomyces sp. R301]NML79557.1 DNA cytosine methyltransferase [Streptomyces sp. R302]
MLDTAPPAPVPGQLPLAPANGLTTVHLFSGGCGDVRGFDSAGYTPVYAANHMAAAVDTVRANWPQVWAQQCDINNLDMRGVPSADGIVGSPICWEATPAGGRATPRAQTELTLGEQQPAATDWSRTRMTAWDPIRYAEVHRPRFYVGENVPGFATRFALFTAWLNVWDALGYNITIASVNAAHVQGEGYERLPQLRDRLVWCMVRKDVGRVPDLRPRPEATCATCGPVRGIQQWSTRYRARTVGEFGAQYRYICPQRRCGHRRVEPVTRGIGSVIDWSVRGHRFGDGRRGRKTHTPYVEATRRRVEAGLDRFEGRPFVITLRNHGTATSLDEPIGTLSAQGGNHHSLVVPAASGKVDDCEYRALATAEKARAQGFPAHHVLAGRDTAQRVQIGNAVPVNLAQWAAERVAAALT